MRLLVGFPQIIDKDPDTQRQMPALVRLQVDRERRYGDTIVTVFKG